METITGNIYICSYCRKKYLSKGGCKNHEKQYCTHKDCPSAQSRIDEIEAIRQRQEDMAEFYNGKNY